MKILSRLAIVMTVVCFAVNACEAQSVAGQTVQATLPDPTPFAIKAQDANSRIWERTAYELDPSGQPVARKHQFSELASGLNHQVNGQWVESKETIDILPNGTAVATNGQHQAYFPGDIYQGQIELVTADGIHLKSRPLGLSYFDGTNTVLIAELTNSIGVVVGDNQVVYPNAFTGLKADLRYTYTKGGFEQDIILKQQPATPESFGLNPDTARLQILTEFFSPPQPTVQATHLPTQAGLSLTDQSLGFGSMQMVPGRAFLMGQNATDAGALVSKHWLLVNGRQFLLEEVPVNAIVQGLATLPLTAMNSGSSKPSHTASKHLALPPQRLAKTSYSKTMLTAKANFLSKGYVLDYQTVSGSTNYTFQADTTYYVSGSFSSFGTNTFEGGTVIKYATNGVIQVVPGPMGNPRIIWNGTAYRPVVFTAVDDNSAGETIGTGNPIGYYGNPMLTLVTVSPTPALTGLRMSYAKTAISFSGASANIYNAQFLNGQYGFAGGGATINLRNVLFANFVTNFTASGGVTVTAQNVTFSGSSCLWATPVFNQGNSFVLSNCIFANIPILTTGYTTPGGGYNGFYNASSFGVSATTIYTYPFQTVGGGNYYLASGCGFTNGGTTNIDSALLANLKQKTIYPPISFTNVNFSTVTNFSPQAAWDTNTSFVSLGYHYDPLDYDFGGCFAYSNMTFTAGTAVGWFRTSSGWSSAGYGIDMKAGVTVSFAGTVTAPTYWVRLNTVQGQDYTAGYGQAGIETWVNSNLPWVRGQFLKCSVLAGEQRSFFSDDNGTIQASMVNSEFWGGYLAGYGDYRYFTNCLMFRTYLSLWNGNTVSSLALRNCTSIGGTFTMQRNSSGPTPVLVTDSAFDGTVIDYSVDYYGANSTYTSYDYNAYTNTTDPFSIGGTHDVLVTSTFNWQTNWFGNFYQATNSLLIDKGDLGANLLGLYHFTTQTNQVKEANSPVDIGYHYVAANAYGNPIDTNGDGIPDYLEDANGNGLYDLGEAGAWFATVNGSIPSAWYTANGLNASDPLIGIKDADMDGLLNQQEYLYGTNPQISDGFLIWISSPNTATSIP